ncbi:MAG: hypothetical protein C0600_14865 [Ignavibacteria bacterium]|nr:MAG: hypothetical protein C0600_14865 [Ignavibacteria bacterium]
MKAHRLIGVLLLLPLLVFASLQAQSNSPTPLYVPPDIASAGVNSHYEHMAIIETDCQTDAEIMPLWRALTENGALVAVVTSPGRMLAWVPPEAKNRILNTRITTAQGEIGVVAVAYDTDALDQGQMLQKRALNEADEALAEFLEWVRLPMTPERQRAMEEAELKYQTLKDVLPNDGPEIVYNAPDNLTGGGDVGIDGHGTKSYGLFYHTTFFLESQSGTGSWNWPTTVYNQYKTLHVEGMAFWAAEASKYGRSMTTVWRLYGRTHWACQVNGEPTVIGEDSFIPTVIDRVTTGTAAYVSGIDRAAEWGLHYNRIIRNQFSADESIIGFIGYKQTSGEAIWPHAVSYWKDGSKEGIYYALDNQYWQAVPDPLANPYRNVIAHEIGHLLGCPDEYYSSQSSCDWTYRGQKNYNCQKTQPAPGHPGYNMRGFDGMMKGNYMGGTSLCTPVHTGLISASSAVPIRRFRTEPVDIPFTVRNCDAGDRTFYAPIYIPVAHDYCMKVDTYAERTVSGTKYYLSNWEVKRKGGGSTTYNHYGTQLPSSALLSSRFDPIVDVIAHFTSTPPNYEESNPTFSAWLSHFNHNVSPDQCIGLRWRSKFDMTKAGTKIEYKRGSSWVEVKTSNIYLYHPMPVGAYRWTGCLVHSVPGVSGDEDIQMNRQYQFRLKGVFNTVEGSPSPVATVTTRPASPADSAFCYDVNETNSQSSPKVLPSMGPGIDPYTIRGAVTVTGQTTEFSWFRPKADYYRVTTIGLTGGLFGKKLNVALRVRDGSDFEPIMTYQRVGTTTEQQAVYIPIDKVWSMNIPNDGEYLIKVTAKITNAGGMHDFADRWNGNFGFGEYTMKLEQMTFAPELRPICPSCVRVLVPRPYPGLVLMDPPPPPELILPTWPGWDPIGPVSFKMQYIAPAGLIFAGFEGFVSGMQNPAQVEVNAQTAPGEHVVTPKYTKLNGNVAELVIIHPEGPGGPIDLRTTHAYGDNVMAEAKPPEGYLFVAWSGDTSAVTNPLPVVMWKHKTLIAYYRPKPCQEDDMPRWDHQINVMNSKQGEVTLQYGMRAGAGDGLEAGQTDLPPVPPPGTFDVRWINIPGSQGSPTDLRAIKEQHTYQGSIQTGNGTTPVILQWSTPPLPPSFTMKLRIPALAVELDMHDNASYELLDEGKYIIYVDVEEPDCPPPTEEPDVDITITRYDPGDFPCVELELLLRDPNTRSVLPHFNPFRLKFYEKSTQGAFVPTRVSEMHQLDSTLLVRLCTDPENKDPEREIVIVPDEDDPDKKKDTTRVPFTPPVPDPTGDLFQFVHDNSGDWEMVSLPVKMDSAVISSLYPDPGTQLYRFDITTGAYANVALMRFGEGYWLKTATRRTLFLGNEVKSNRLTGLSGIGNPPAYGWNMVGGISHSVSVASITQNPANCMKSIFGWDPASGYIIPTSVDPSIGYWVRTEPGAALTLAVTTVQSGGKTAYEKTAAAITTAGMLRVLPGTGSGQMLLLADRQLLSEEKDDLMLPMTPPGSLFDARVDNSTLFLSPGTNTLKLQHDGVLQLSFTPQEGALTEVLLTDVSGAVLHRFRTDQSSVFALNVKGSRTVLMRYDIVKPAELTFALEQNYPNPLRAGSTTAIRYTVNTDKPVRLEVYDLLGRRVTTLVNAARRPGRYSAMWDGRDDNGSLLPSGLYMYRLEADGNTLTRRCTIVR